MAIRMRPHKWLDVALSPEFATRETPIALQRQKSRLLPILCSLRDAICIIFVRELVAFIRRLSRTLLGRLSVEVNNSSCESGPEEPSIVEKESLKIEVSFYWAERHNGKLAVV